MSWTHKVIKYADYKLGCEMFQVCEDYGEFGHTGEIAPVGESIEELREELKMMLHAVEETISGNREMIEEEYGS